MEHGVAKGFTFFRSWWEAIKDAPDKERLEIYDALSKYAFTGQIDLEELSFSAKMFVVSHMPTLDESIKKSIAGARGAEEREKNRRAKKQNQNCFEAEMKVLPSSFESASNGEERRGVESSVEERSVEESSVEESSVEDDDPPTPHGVALSIVSDSPSVRFYLANGKSLSKSAKQEIMSFEKILGSDVVKYAMEITINESKGIGYLRGILNNKKRDGITSLAKWDEHEQSRKKMIKQPSLVAQVEKNYYEGMSPEDEVFWRNVNNEPQT